MARQHMCELQCPKCTGLTADARLHRGWGGRRDKTTSGTLKLSQVTCKHSYKELPARNLVSIRAGRTINPFKQETCKLGCDTAFGTLIDLLAKSSCGPLARAGPWFLTAGQALG